MKSLLISLLLCMAVICHAKPKTVRLHGTIQTANLSEIVLKYFKACKIVMQSR